MKAAALALALSIAAWDAAAQRPSRAEIEDGRAIAQHECGACHGLDYATRSPRKDAPPFRSIGRRYRFPVLQEELIEGVKLGHPDMPRFQLPPQGVDALIAYLRDIQTRDPRTRRKKTPG